MSPRRPWSERIHDLLLRSFPRDFRSDYGAEMSDCFRDRRRDLLNRRGSLHWLRGLPRQFVGLVLAGLGERLDSHHTPANRINRPSTKHRERWHAQMRTDLLDAARTLVRHRTASGIVIATLALGLGACVTFFGLVDAVLLKPLPYPEADRLVHLQNHYGDAATSMSPPDFMDRRGSSLFQSAAAYEAQSRQLNLETSGADEALPVTGRRVTAAFFSVLGVAPELGRVSFPAAEDDVPPDQVVLSHALWRDAFGASEDLIGESVRLHGRVMTVQAVMPPGFDFPAGTDAWMPMTFRPDQLADTFRGNEYILMLGRMAPSTSAQQLQAEMDSITSALLPRLARRGFLTENRWGVRVSPMQEQLVRAHRPALVSLLAAVLLVLLLACFNVANLLLSRTAKRSRELALRSSLGATRARLLRRLFTENLMLAGAGGLIGLLGATWALRMAPSWVPFDVPGLERAGVDARVAAAALALGALSVLLFGLIPALQGAAINLRSMAGPALHARGGHRLRASFVVAQICIALVLLVGAGLLLRSFSQLLDRDPGFEPDGRIALRISLPAAEYPDDEDRRAAFRRLTAALEEIPGVISAAVADRLPFDGRAATSNFRRIGDPPDDDSPPSGEMSLVGPSYFRTMGIPVLEGRGMAFGDADGPAVAVVDRRAVELFWNGESPLGHRIYFSSAERSYEVVGVVGSVRQHSLAEVGSPHVYLSAERFTNIEPTVVLSTADVPATDLMLDVRETLRATLPGVPPFSVRTLEGSIADNREPARFQAWLLGGFALSALALAALGLYGLLSHLVQLRTSEIGIRMALGADRRRVLADVLAEGLRLTAFGTVLGMLVAYGATSLLEELLVDVRPDDALTFLLVVAALGAVALLASALPARRASHLDPVRAIQRH